jgi:hypothetical protein
MPPPEKDLPGPILTLAVGEFGRAVGRMIGERLATENDDGLQRTLDAFLRRTGQGRGASADLSAAIGALAQNGKLDDLALELGVSQAEFIATHPNVRYYGPYQRLSDAVAKYGDRTAKDLWSKAAAKTDRMLNGPGKVAKEAAYESARELTLAIDKGDQALLERAAGGLITAFTGANSSLTLPFAKTKLETGLKRLADSARLDEVVQALEKTPNGKRLLTQIDDAVKQHGTRATKALWKEAGGKSFPTSNPRPPVTTFGPFGEEGRGPEPPVATTLAVGEESRPDDPGRMTTLAVGEEGRGFDPGRFTTMAVGEEGRGTPTDEPVATTLAVGEEGRGGSGSSSGPIATTMAVGEEGRGPGFEATTLAVGEEGRADPQ